jgi:hypothetical protein
MKHQNIHTKYHKLSGSRMALDVFGKALPHDQFHTFVDAGLVSATIDGLTAVPRYVIQQELIDMLRDPNSAMQKSLSVMIDTGIAHLPFKSVVVEFDEIGYIKHELGEDRIPVRHFTWLTERDEEQGRFTAMTWSYMETRDGQPWIGLSPIVASCDLMTPEMVRKVHETKAVEIYGGDGPPGEPASLMRCGAMFRAAPSYFLRKDDPRLTKTIESWVNSEHVDHAMNAAVKALCALVVLMHTRGVAKEVIEINPRFNKCRVQAGRPPIQDHTVIKIGHVYDRSGNQVEYRQSGRTMPVHWRSGHYRMQRYGTKLSMERKIFIEPMLVNYVEGEDTPTPKIKEVTV